MAVHITGGDFGGRRLETLSGLSARPTSSSVRKAIFSILGGSIIGAKVIDFFCAGGTLGIEALSQGAESCCFVENGYKAIRVLKKNIENLQLWESSELLAMNVLSSIRVLEKKGEGFDILFADPPYGKPLALPLINRIQTSNILNEGAIMVLEISSRNKIRFPASIEVIKSRVSGDTAIHFISFDS